jgi:enoyl-CoA hydratase/carnithine racemase
MELISDTVQYEMHAGVACVILAAPHSGNAINTHLLQGVRRSIERATADESCRAIVISAQGPDFCTGLDLAEAFGEGQHRAPELLRMFRDCLLLIATTSRPVIAVIEGNVTGGGVGLMAACDVTLAAKNATFMLPEVVLGLIPAVVSPFLLRRLAPARVTYMTLSSRGLSAAEAHVFGLVDEVAEDDMTATLKRQLQRIFRSSPLALAASKQYIARLGADELFEQTEIALERFLPWVEQPSVVEEIYRFLEGFSPTWFQKYG